MMCPHLRKAILLAFVVTAIAATRAGACDNPPFHYAARCKSYSSQQSAYGAILGKTDLLKKFDVNFDMQTVSFQELGKAIGEADFVEAPTGMILTRALGNSNIRIVATPITRTKVQIWVNRSSSIQQVADLKGRKIAMGPAGLGYNLALRQALAKAGLNQQEVARVVAPGQGGIQATLAGVADAFIVKGALPTTGMEQQLRLVDTLTITFAERAIAVRADHLDDERNVLAYANLLKAMIDSGRYLRDQAESAKKLIDQGDLTEPIYQTYAQTTEKPVLDREAIRNVIEDFRIENPDGAAQFERLELNKLLSDKVVSKAQ